MRIAKTLIVLVVAFCVQIVCVPAILYVSPKGPCKPGDLVFVGFCNLCMCNKEGIPNQLCATSWCRVKKLLPPRDGKLNSSSSTPFT